MRYTCILRNCINKSKIIVSKEIIDDLINKKFDEFFDKIPYIKQSELEIQYYNSTSSDIVDVTIVKKIYEFSLEHIQNTLIKHNIDQIKIDLFCNAYIFHCKNGELDEDYYFYKNYTSQLHNSTIQHPFHINHLYHITI